MPVVVGTRPVSPDQRTHANNTSIRALRNAHTHEVTDTSTHRHITAAAQRVQAQEQLRRSNPQR
eukprot:3715316-Rhodomonas_salina.1